jgi:4-hydroxybenzoate polyprenyltransferase
MGVAMATWFNRLAAAVKLIRPKHWIKNGFVFTALIFAKELFLVEPLMNALRAFGAFCLTASAIYIINDIFDAEADRAHPKKRFRPIAAGTISIPQALALLGVIMCVDVLLLWPLPGLFKLIVIAYFVMNLAYSFRLKEVMLLDVFIIATGFMLRVLGGAYAIGVVVSNWLVLCSMFVSLFLGFAKRRGELVAVQNAGVQSERKVLQHYRLEVIDQFLTIAAAGTVISYALYTVAQRTITVFGTDKLIYTTVFVIYGVFRYLHLVHATDSIENPTAVVATDIPIIVVAGCWIISCVILIYFRDLMPGL